MEKQCNFGLFYSTHRVILPKNKARELTFLEVKGHPENSWASKSKDVESALSLSLCMHAPQAPKALPDIHEKSCHWGN